MKKLTYVLFVSLMGISSTYNTVVAGEITKIIHDLSTGEGKLWTSVLANNAWVLD